MRYPYKNVVLTVPAALLVFFLSAVASLGSASGNEAPEVPVAGIVTMLDLGATKCVPCKMMAPIMEKMEKAYEGKAAIVFIDVWEHRNQAQKFGIRSIPTQIFFDAQGKEVYRHVGFMGEEEIVVQLAKMGVAK